MNNYELLQMRVEMATALITTGQDVTALSLAHPIIAMPASAARSALLTPFYEALRQHRVRAHDTAEIKQLDKLISDCIATWLTEVDASSPDYSTALEHFSRIGMRAGDRLNAEKAAQDALEHSRKVAAPPFMQCSLALWLVHVKARSSRWQECEELLEMVEGLAIQHGLKEYRARAWRTRGHIANNRASHGNDVATSEPTLEPSQWRAAIAWAQLAADLFLECGLFTEYRECKQEIETWRPLLPEQ